MKFFIMMTIFAWGSAYAEVPTVRASKVTCQELKQTVEKYGAANVKSKKLGIFNSTKFVQHKATCSTDQYTRTFSFKTKDVRACVVGEWCEDPYVYTGGGYDTDPSPSPWERDTPDTDRGPRYDPPSRDDHDRGPRYDPPSRDDNDRGPRYDPPTRGDNERGPRYCPNCSF